MKETTYMPEEGEILRQQRVGHRLQDVILNVKTVNPTILRLRGETMSYLQSAPRTNGRTATLDTLCKNILDMRLNDMQEEAKKVLIPYRSNGTSRKMLIISSASSASASQETESAILKTRGHVIDIPGAIEGRDTRSAEGGDTALISTQAGLLMSESKKNVRIIDLASEKILDGDDTPIYGSDIYYKSDGLLLLMATNPDSKVLSQLVEEISQNPLVCPYNLDEETQLALLWLAKRSGIKQIDVNANSPEVGIELTRKGFRYPTIEDALNVPYQEDPYRMQTEEWKKSQAAKEIDYHPDYVPGYVVNQTDTYEEFHKKVRDSLLLLSKRYGLGTAWTKPDRGTDGGNQGPLGTDTLNDEAISARAREMWEQGGNWVIEAKTNYFEIKLPLDSIGKTLKTTPSVHMIKGEPKNTISLQLVDGVAWGGNLICSQETWNRLVDMIELTDDRIMNHPDLRNQLREIYTSMPQAMDTYVEAINKSERYRNGQVRGGADLAVATLGGKFGDDRIIVAVQDYNARANGCETAYALYDEAQKIYGPKGEAITRNLTPKVDFNKLSSELPNAINEMNACYRKNLSEDQVRIIAVSAGWGQLGIIGIDPIEITQSILLLEMQMRKSGLIQ